MKTGLAVVTAAVVGLAADIPVVPDGDTAREWARQELADPIYHRRESLFDQARTWLMDLLREMLDSAGRIDVRAASIVLGSVVVVAVLLILAFNGPVRRARRLRESTRVFEDDARTAAEMRASADAFAAAGRWNEAVLDRFRAILRSLEERAVLEERPGWTADEATAQAAVVLPPCATDLRGASGLFDDVCYGDRAARPEDDAWLSALDRTVQDSRPVAAPTAAPEVLVAPR